MSQSLSVLLDLPHLSLADNRVALPQNQPVQVTESVASLTERNPMDWTKVVTQPAGLAAYALALVFVLLSRSEAGRRLPVLEESAPGSSVFGGWTAKACFVVRLGSGHGIAKSDVRRVMVRCGLRVQDTNRRVELLCLGNDYRKESSGGEGIDDVPQ